MKAAKTPQAKIATILLNRKVLAALFIVIGLALIFFFGSRAFRAYRELQYIREQGLDRGVASVEAIRGWMPIRYVSVAYAVPEEYIFDYLGIPFTERSSNDTLGHLNRVYRFGDSGPGEPAIVDRVAEAILAYRENPVATGLDDIRPWMTIRYVANSTGVPEAYLLEQLGLDAGHNHPVMPLHDLADVTRYKGGPRGLIEAIKMALARYEGE
jgi:hypothetical protein